MCFCLSSVFFFLSFSKVSSRGVMVDLLKTTALSCTKLFLLQFPMLILKCNTVSYLNTITAVLLTPNRGVQPPHDISIPCYYTSIPCRI